MRPCDISTLLGQMEADDLNSLDRQTRDVVRAVEETGLVGEINLKIKIKKNSENSTLISTEVKTKVPRKPAGNRVMFFAFDDKDMATGELSVLPHKQEALFRAENVTPIRKDN